MNKQFQTLTQFTVTVANKPGQLANITSLLAASGVNITNLESQPQGPVAFVRFTTDVPTTKIQDLLSKAGFTAYQTPVVSVTLSNKPGELNKLVQSLFKQGFNLTSIFSSSNIGTESTILFTAEPTGSGATPISDVLQKFFGTVAVTA